MKGEKGSDCDPADDAMSFKIRQVSLDQTASARRPPKDKLIHHSDRGSQYLSTKYTEKLTDAGIQPSVGSIGESYANDLTETIYGPYKAEVVLRYGP
jgi:putative transposase